MTVKQALDDELGQLDQIPVSKLKGAGPKTRERLEKIGINSLQDLLFHLPIRYEDRTRLTPIGRLQANQTALFEGEIVASGVVPGRRRSLTCQLRQNASVISLRFFNFSRAQVNSLSPGTMLRCYGEPRLSRRGLECFHPEYTILRNDQEQPLADTLTPRYPTTEKLHQASIRKLIEQALPYLASHEVSELLPAPILAELSSLLPGAAQLEDLSLANCLRSLHTPRRQELRLQSVYQQRLAFEELLAHHLSLLQLRARQREQEAPIILADSATLRTFTENLGFVLTTAQKKVDAEIADDLATNQSMLRLVQGDVGCGKTVVAAMAALRTIACGFQCAFMAPTEILVEQHFTAFQQWFTEPGINCVMLSGQQSAADRRDALEKIGNGSAQMIVGTHALIQDTVVYRRLGLIIIDEQHRFGVNQRLSLRQKALDSGVCPHQLIMTATPIPRTLAMTDFADLDVSIIDELPPGRTPVTTSVVDSSARAKVVARVHNACQQKRQAYWVCTAIEPSEAVQCQAAEDTANELQQALPDLSVGLVHGRLKTAEKSAVMQSFKQGTVDLLVATTVIEVGVDVPNASLMIIENSERLGLSQIHQLRGRVGRGATESFCVLMYQAPLSADGRERLDILRSSSDGFYIAEQDLQLRGPGEMLGTRQTGDTQFRIADLQRDSELLDYVHELGERLHQSYPEKIAPLITRWLGNASAYGNA